VQKKDEGWDPMDWMKAAAQVVRAPFRPADKSAKESIEGAITKALGGTRKGYYRGVDLALDGVLSDDINNYINGFCSALSKGLNAKWYACGRYAVSSEGSGSATKLFGIIVVGSRRERVNRPTTGARTTHLLLQQCVCVSKTFVPVI